MRAAKFEIGKDPKEYVLGYYARPVAALTRCNEGGADCWYASGAWYVPAGKGYPTTTSGGPLWGVPGDVEVVPDQAFKADGGKPNWFLLMSGKGCAAALAGVVRVLSFAVRPVTEGGKGYTEHSWRQVPNARERYEAALYRHLNKIALGELVDDESGESHWDHVATNALFLSELTKAGK